MTFDPVTLPSGGWLPHDIKLGPALETSELPLTETSSRIIAQHYPILDACPLDQLNHFTCLRIARKLRHDHEAFARKTNLPLRSIKPYRAKGFSSYACGFSIDLLTYGGVKLKISPPSADGFSDVKVQLNPGKILYGHNGRATTYDEFLDALSIYKTHAKHILEDPDDWPDLIPGLHVGGPAHWKSLELPTHYSDPDSFIFAVLRHMRHPKIRTQARHWPTSIELGSKRATLQFSIYFKAIEMLNRGKLPEKLLSHYADILRLEVRLRGKKLLRYFGSDDTVEVIDGEKCLVRFFPDLIAHAPRAIFRELQNVWHSDETQELAGQLAPLGNLIAHVASDPRCGHSFPELIRQLTFYTRVGSKRDTIRTIRGAGASVMSRRSTLHFDDLFGDAAFKTQPSIAIPEIECKVSHRLEDIRRHPLLEAAYLPPGHISSRSNPFPEYCR